MLKVELREDEQTERDEALCALDDNSIKPITSLSLLDHLTCVAKYQYLVRSDRAIVFVRSHPADLDILPHNLSHRHGWSVWDVRTQNGYLWGVAL